MIMKMTKTGRSCYFFTQNDQDDDHVHDCHLLCCQLFPRRLQMILNLPDICAQACFLRFHVLKLSLQLRERVSLEARKISHLFKLDKFGGDDDIVYDDDDDDDDDDDYPTFLSCPRWISEKRSSAGALSPPSSSISS